VTRPKLIRALARFVRAPAERGDRGAPVPVAASTVEVVDRAHRAGLAEALGPEGLAELTAVFRDDADRLLAEIAEAAARGDREAARKALHTLKGAAANVGLVGVVAAVDEIRAAGGIDAAEAGGRLAAAVLAGWRALAEEGVAFEPAARSARRA